MFAGHWVPVADVSMLIQHLCYHHIIALIFVCSVWSTVTYLTAFKTLTALMLLVLCHHMVAAYCWLQMFCCRVTTETVTFLWPVKAPNLIRCLLNNDTDSYYSLLSYDTMWSGGGYQRFGGVYCLHLQGRSQPRYESTHCDRGPLNNDTASYSNLGYDTMWSNCGSQYFGGAYCLHLQGRSQPSWESGWLYMNRSWGGGKYGSC